MSRHSDYERSEAVPVRRRRRQPIGCGIFMTVCGVIIGLTIVFVILTAMFGSELRSIIFNNGDSSDESTSSVINGKIEGESPIIDAKNHKEDFFTAIVAGTDKDGTRTDTILVVAFDTKNDTLSLLSIPRDTRSYMDNGKYHKINAAHNKGIEQMQKEIKNTIGFVPDNYVVINYDAFEQLIDAIGGVKIDVEQDMNYKDPDQDLVIDIKAGTQTLNGEDALKYMRFRSGYIDADLGRIKAQQKMFTAVAKAMFKPSTLLKIPEIATILTENVETDLDFSEIIWLGTKLISLESENMRTDMLPGEAKGADYVGNEDEILALVNEIYNPYLTPIEELNIPN